MENKTCCISCDENLFENIYGTYTLSINNDKNHIEIKHEDNDVFYHCETFLFGYYNRVNIHNFKNWIDDPYERHYKNLNFSLKEFPKNDDFSKCTLSLKNCLDNIYKNLNSTNYNLCHNCFILLNVCGCLIMIYCNGIYDTLTCGFIKYFCCIRCEKPNNDYFQNIHHLKINYLDNKYIIGNSFEYIYYQDDDIDNKCNTFHANSNYNFMVCKSCFDHIAFDKLYTLCYYYNKLLDTDKIVCSSCNLTQKYISDNTKNNAKHYFCRGDCFVEILNDINFDNIISLINNDYKLVNSNNRAVVKEISSKYYNYLCSNSFMFTLKVNYLNTNMHFLLDLLPKEICALILEYFVLYFNICNTCVSNKIQSKELQEKISTDRIFGKSRSLKFNFR